MLLAASHVGLAGGDTKRRKLEAIRELAEDDPVVRFWKALREVNEEVGDSGAEVLRLPDGVFWGGDEEMGSTLVVRQCYKDLFRIITSSRRKRFVVTGTPGIGKSFFALYWLWRVANVKGGSAIYETGRFRCRLFCADGNVSDALRDDALSAGWFVYGDKRFYLVDLMEKAMPYHEFRSKTVVFCLPDPSRFKAFIKGVGKKLYMPIWSDEEMRRLRLECFEEVDTSVAAEQARMYGNIPRFVLQMAEDGDEELENAISKRGGDLSSLFRAAGDDAGDDTKLSYKLLHMLVDPDSTYTKQRLGWASQHVLTRLLQVHKETMTAELKDFVAHGTVDGAYGSLRGHLFEGFAHRELAAGRIGTLRRLDADATHAEAAALSAILSTGHDQTVFLHLVGEELSLDKLLVPKARNLESLDSLLISSDGDVVLFSVTVSKARGAKVRGLREAVQAAAQALTVRYSSGVIGPCVAFAH